MNPPDFPRVSARPTDGRMSLSLSFSLSQRRQFSGQHNNAENSRPERPPHSFPVAGDRTLRNWRNSQRSRCIYTGSCSRPRYEVSRFSERLPAGAGREVSCRIAARTDEPGCRDWIQRELTDIVYKWKPPLRGATRIDVTRTGDYRHVGWLIPSRRVTASRLHSYPESAFLCNPRTGYRNQVMTALWALVRNYVWRGGNRRISGQPGARPGCRRDSSPSHALPLTLPLEN